MSKRISSPVVGIGITFLAAACSSAGLPEDSEVDSSTFGIHDDDDDHCSQEERARRKLIRKGEKAFNKGLKHLGGNDRECATCHIPNEEFMLKPETVEARFQALKLDRNGNPKFEKDPLFRSIDANDFATDFTNLRKGLVRVVIPLHPDITIDELPGATSIALWRKVPSVKDVAFTAPYQLDGRVATLQEQALQAARAHSEVTTDPSPETLDALAAFQLAQFSNHRAKTIGEAFLAGEPLPPPFPTDLNEQETRGKSVFEAKCQGCHASSTTENFELPKGTQKFHNIMSTLTTHRNFHNLPVYTWRCKNPDGTIGVRPARNDAGRAIITGRCADFARFESRPLFDVVKKAPYLHDASAATLEDVMAVYNTFFFNLPSPAVQQFGPPMSPQDTADVIAFTKRL